MKKIKNLFGDVNLSYKVVIVLAIVIGILVGGLNSIPLFKDTTITDIASVYAFWIFWGIFIIMNSKSNLDAAIKCFIFFLISQPLIYLVEVPFNSMGWELFRYYKFWFILTLLCFPMGFIGYYMKKDRWYGLVILTPILILLCSEITDSYTGLLYAFPHHLVNLIMVIVTAIIYPLVIFNNKKVKYTGLAISILLVLGFGIYIILGNKDYETIIKCSSEEFYFDDSYNAYLEDSKYGDLSIEYDNAIESYCINAKFHRTGDTKLVLENKDNKKNEYNLTIGKNTYNLDID